MNELPVSSNDADVLPTQDSQPPVFNTENTAKVFHGKGGTTFAIRGHQVEITKSDQPICFIPLVDLQQFGAHAGATA